MSYSYLDLRGAICPMAFVKTRLFLDGLNTESTAKILYEATPGNAPFERSVAALGHVILARRLVSAPTDETWDLSASPTALTASVDLIELLIQVKN